MNYKLIIVCLVASVATLTGTFSKGGDVDGHWERPFTVSGRDYGDFKEAEKVLPKNCSTCHKSQFNDWSKSFHRRATGPGLLGQLDIKNDPDFAQSCYYCHAPAREQSSLNPKYNKGLHKEGVSCVVCHMRGGTVYGPMRSGNIGISLYGHKTKTESFFSESEFCAACHQMDGGFSINGKVLTNTFAEWKESKYAKSGATCQTCHMPDRKHLFKGIHDKDMTLSALTIDVAKDKNKLKAVITNSGAGHYFPTYVTPLVVVSVSLKDKNGAAIAGTLKEDYIGRVVPVDLSKEVMDTRIPPDGEFVFDYDIPKVKGVKSALFQIVVHPDMFYKHFFKSTLNDQSYTNRSYIEEALKTAESSPYILYSKEISIP